MCPRGSIALPASPQGDDGEHPACSESVILPMCNVIYLGMQRYLSSSRGPRAEAGARGPRRAPGAPRGAGGGPPRAAGGRAPRPAT